MGPRTRLSLHLSLIPVEILIAMQYRYPESSACRNCPGPARWRTVFCYYVATPGPLSELEVRQAWRVDALNAQITGSQPCYGMHT
jgi:hypothetical protein